MATEPLNAWLAYARERYPVPVYLLLAAGYVLTGWAVTKTPLSWSAFGFGMLCFMLFFFTLRLMDELKDYSKDVIAHPERPLPRGLIGVGQARRAILVCMAGMFALAAVAGIALTPASGALFAVSAVYLWLMYKEFFIGQKLGNHPFAYAISHQFIGVPLLGFSASLFDAHACVAPALLPAAFMILGAFLCYEVCRKLDPQAHPLLGTYLVVYGRPKTVAIVVAATAVAGLAAWRLGVPALFWIFEVLVPASFVLPKERYKITETLATLSLLVHVLGLPILHAAGVFQP